MKATSLNGRTVAIAAVALAILLAGCGSGTGGNNATPTGGNATATETAMATATETAMATATETAMATATETPTKTATPTTTSTPGDGGDGGDGGDQPTPDPASDTLGWESVGDYGIWYNESIDVDNGDGVNDSELDQLLARSMARIEHIRQLEFTEGIDVTIRSREAYRENVTENFENMTEKDRIHQNVKFEATFMVGENSDAVAAQKNNLAGSVAGFYDPEIDKIVVVSDNPDTLQMDGFTLAHELVHALQDQHWNLSSDTLNGKTEDTNNGVSGIVEGDANYVEAQYKNRCNNRSHAWNGTCVRPSDSGGGSSSDIHIGMFLISFTPYSDGPVLVNSEFQQGGWEAVNEMYENPPASSEQVVHPEKYGTDAPVNVTVEDTSSGDWRILNLTNGSIDYAQFGESGLYSMLWYPSYENRRSNPNVIIPLRSLFSNVKYDSYNYSNPLSDGWGGEKLYPYVTNESGQTNETGYVWKITWDTEADAKKFVSGYERLLKFHGAESVTNSTWKIPDKKEFGDAFYVERNGDTVVIVNGPTVEDLSEIREGAAPNAPRVTAED